MTVVALLDSDFDLAERIDRQEAFSEPVRYTLAWRRARWEGAQTHLAVLFDEDGDVRWLGAARGGRPITTVDRIVEVAQIIELTTPLSQSTVAAKMSVRHRSVLSRRGILPQVGGAELQRALRELVPELADVIERLGSQQDRRLPGGGLDPGSWTRGVMVRRLAGA